MLYLHDWFTEQVMMGIVMTCAACAVHFYKLVKRDEFTIPVMPVLWVGLAFWLLAISSVFTAELHFEAFIKIGLFSTLPLSFLFVATGPLNKRESRLKMLLCGMLTIAAAMAIGSIYQYFFLPDMLFKGRAHYPFNNPNSMGAFLSLSFFTSLGIWLLNTRRWWFLALCGLFFFGLMTTGSRGATLFLLLMSVPLVLFTSHDLDIKGRLKRFGIIYGILTVLFLAPFVLPKAERLPQHDITPISVIDKTAKGITPALWDRPLIWNTVWKVIQDHPITGVGIGNLHYYYQLHQSPKDTSSGFHAHSDPLQYWAELGIAAPFLFYSFIFLGAYLTWSVMSGVKDRDLRIKVLVPFFALGAFLGHGHFSFNMQFLNMLMFSGILIGIWYSYLATAGHFGPRPIPLPRSWSPGNRALLVSGAIIIFIITYIPMMSSFTMVKFSNRALASGDLEKYEFYNRAVETLSLGQNARAHMLRMNFPLMVLERMPNLNQNQRNDLLRSLETNLRRAKETNPYLKDTFPRERRYLELKQKYGR